MSDMENGTRDAAKLGPSDLENVSFCTGVSRTSLLLKMAHDSHEKQKEGVSIVSKA
jgi:hypothetical protein